MPTRYVHTNIIASDWRSLAGFYIAVFGCRFVPPERDQGGLLLEDGTGVKGAHLRGVHLRLPGHGEDGPTLEIYSYTSMLEKPPAAANRKGYSHLAFAVDDVTAMVAHVVERGGRAVGEVVSHDVPGAGRITYAYVADPEDNIIEVQRWD